jgi:hypothetical protein
MEPKRFNTAFKSARHLSLSYSHYYYYYYYYYYSLSGSAAQRRLLSPRPRGFLITHNDAPQSVGLLWTRDQLVAETST